MRKQTLGFLCAVGVCSASVALAQPSPVFVGDFETGDLSQYSSIDVHPGTTDRLTVVENPTRQGRYALKATVHPGDYVKLGSRAEVVVTNPLFHEGEERWFHWQTMFPADFKTSPNWHLFIQWHSGDFGVPLQFNLHGEQMSFRVMGHQYDAQGDYTGGKLWSAPLQRGEWMDFLLRVKFSADPQKGFVELWKDGQKVVTQTFHQTLYAGGSVYMKQGLYRHRDISWVQSVYHDGVTVYAERPEHLFAPPSPPEEPQPPTQPQPPAQPSPEEPLETVEHSLPTPPITGGPSSPEDVSGQVGVAGCGASSAAGVLFPLAALAVLPVLRRVRRRR